MKVQYDEEADAAYIQLSSGSPDGAVEIEDGVILHTTKEHSIISIEILDASKKFPIQNLYTLERAS
ncbi:MAG: DUF2283 domain-containing protein [Nitrospinae bacterium]|nr:DUF2283 domain-containing protein [Nitrospinota bacterium]